MAATVNDLLDNAKTLSEHSRIDVAERILETLDYSDEVMRSHLAIIEKRVEEVKSGKVKLIPAEEVFREADAILKSRKRLRISILKHGQNSLKSFSSMPNAKKVSVKSSGMPCVMF